MRITSILSGWPIRRQTLQDYVTSEADALMDIWGEEAYRVAANLSWREDTGLLQSSSPGHWGRVQREIGRRLSIADGPKFDEGFAAAA